MADSKNGPAAKALRVVLDTNVVLDWLLFADAAMSTLGTDVEQGRVQWLCCPRLRDELAHALAKPALARRQPDAAAILARFDRHAVMQPPPPAQHTLRCSDGADQVFLDLALAHGAPWLLSRDRALLRLHRRAATRGLRIAAPSGWRGL